MPCPTGRPPSDGFVVPGRQRQLGSHGGSIQDSGLDGLRRVQSSLCWGIAGFGALPPKRGRDGILHGGVHQVLIFTAPPPQVLRTYAVLRIYNTLRQPFRRVYSIPVQSHSILAQSVLIMIARDSSNFDGPAGSVWYARELFLQPIPSRYLLPI